MLEKMSAFFEARLNGYDEHMLNEIDSAKKFYPFTASCLPQKPNCHILDLGCGTGLELEFYLKQNPSANITGIDLSRGMLDALRKKLPLPNITLIEGSYFDLPFQENCYDSAVSVESLHHFTQSEKIPLYQKLKRALKDDGYFILTDYFAANDADEILFRSTYEALKKEQGIKDHEFYHYDTPLTVAHEIEALRLAGFSSVEILSSWGSTYTLKASV